MPRQRNSAVLADLVDLDFRVRWWNRLTVDNPQVAQYLMNKYPDRYPIVRSGGRGAPTSIPLKESP